MFILNESLTNPTTRRSYVPQPIANGTQCAYTRIFLRTFRLQSLARLAAIVLIGALSTMGGTVTSDDFHAATLNTALWTLVNPVGDGSLTLTGSNLLITVPGGANHDPQFGGANNSVRVVQVVTNTDFQVEVKFNSKPSQQYQMEGVLVEQDAANYLRFEISSNTTSTYLSALKIVGNTQTTILSTQITIPSTDIWLRIQRTGANWTLTWSTDGTTFSAGAAFTQALNVARLGPYAATFGSPAPAFTASVDYFFDRSSPITPEDAGGPGMGGITVTPSSTGATFTWTTDVAASSRVDYGTTQSYGTNQIDAALVTGHTLTVANLACGTVYNYKATSVTVGGSSSSPNRTFATNACAAVPDLTASSSHAGNFTQGGTGSYTIGVQNAGAASTSGSVSITDTLSGGLTAIGLSGIGWTCSVPPTLTCSRNDTLAANSSYPPVNLTVSLDANAPASATNTVTVSGGGETNTANNTASDPTTINPSAGGGPISDDFHTPTLNGSLWTIVNPLGDGIVAVTGSHLLLTVPAGTNHDPQFGGANNSLRLLQPVANSNFLVEARFDSKPTEQYQMQGVMVEQDASNYLRFEISANSTSTYLSALKVIGNQQTSLLSTPISIPASSVWLRIQRAGTTWTMTWSINGTAFNAGATFTQALIPARTGPYAGNYGNPAPAFTASVDYFFNNASPINPEDAGGPGMGVLTVVPSSTGATFTWTTDASADSRVDFGTTASLGSNVADPALVTSHSIGITGLACSTIHNAKSTSTAAGGSTMSPTVTFSTAACAASPDLTIIKNHTVTFTQGGTGAYAITVSNSGGAATSGSVSVTDTLPAGLLATSIIGTGWTCSTPPTLSCSRSDALSPGASYPVITLNVSVAANAAANVINTASVFGGGETNTANDTATDPTTINPSGGAGPISDDFHSTTLNSGLWTLVNPLSDGSAVITGSNLLLTVPGGTNHDPQFGGVNNSVRLVQTITNVDFLAETKFDSKPSQQYQMQGILVEQDASNYLRFEISSNTTTTYISALKIVGNSQTTILSTPISAAGTNLWLRVQRTGTNWTLTWSTNGTVFNTGVTFAHALNTTRIGPYAGNFGSPAPAFTVSVDYFFNTASPINPEDAGGPGVGLVTVSPTNTGATVTWTTDVAAGSRVDYGNTSSYGNNLVDPTLTTTHSIAITGLTCATTYNLRATSTVAGGTTPSPNKTFRTDICGGSPDLLITKTHNGSFRQGSTGSYVITVSNAGTSATSGTVSVSDSLPSGLAAITISGSGWTCASPPTLSCTRSDTLNSAASYPPITLTVSIAANAPPSLTNTATVSGGGDSNTSNNGASDPTTVSGPSSNPTSDDFRGTALNPDLWTFIDPLGGSVALTGTNLLLSVQGGVTHDPVSSGANYSTRVMQSMSNVDFGLEVKFDSVPNQLGTVEGILVQQDGSNFLRFEFQGGAAGSTSLFVGKVIGNSSSTVFNSSIGVTGASLWMRLTRTGSNWAVTWSPDGMTYRSGTSFSQAFTVSAIGPMVGNSGNTGPTTPDFTASIDYFFNLASPIAPQDGGSPRISNVTAIVGPGSAAISWNTDENATSRVDYGPSSTHGSTTGNSVLVTAHSVLLTGLNCGSTYNYDVVSVNGTNTSMQSPNFTFTIPPCAFLSSVASDSFDNAALNLSTWTWLDPKGDSYLAFNGTTAQLTVAANSTHNPISFAGNAGPRIVQSISDINFDVAAKFVSEVYWGTTGQGIVVEQNALNYLLFELRCDGATTSVWVGARAGANTTVLLNVPYSGHAPLWLRVTRSGSNWTVSRSGDGTTYTQVGTFQRALVVSSLGLYATNNGSTLLATPAFTASIDAFVNIAAPLSNVAAPAPFSRIMIDPNPGTVLVQETMGDLDGDGRPDAIVGFAYPNQGIAWYRSPHSGVLTDKWDRFVITASGQSYEDMIVYDVNGDGFKDLIASIDATITWYENPMGHGGDPTTAPWIPHVISANAPGENNFILKDMDGDGLLDLVTPHTIFFRTGSGFTQTKDYNTAFRGLALLDIGSGKGAINIVATDPNTPYSFVWFENPRETGGNARTGQWISHFIGASYPCSDPPSCFGGGSVSNLATGDLNGDGRSDLVTVQSEGYPVIPPGGIIWWEAPADRRNGTWIRHTMDPVFPSPHNVWVADIDKNGTLDVITAEQEQSPERRVSVFFNDGHGNFSLQILSNFGSHNPFLVDINGDGWLDLFSVGHGRFGAPNPVELYINPRGGFRLP